MSHGRLSKMIRIKSKPYELLYSDCGGTECAVRPFMPFTSDRMRTMLNLPPIEEKGELLKVLDRLAEGEFLIKPGTPAQSA
jgi:hypothetical protein